MTAKPTKSPRELRSEVIAIRERWYRREVTMDEVHAVVGQHDPQNPVRHPQL